MPLPKGKNKSLKEVKTIKKTRHSGFFISFNLDCEGVPTRRINQHWFYLRSSVFLAYRQASSVNIFKQPLPV